MMSFCSNDVICNASCGFPYLVPVPAIKGLIVRRTPKKKEKGPPTFTVLHLQPAQKRVKIDKFITCIMVKKQ